VQRRQGLNTSQGSMKQTEISKQMSKTSGPEEMNDPFVFQNSNSGNNNKKLNSDELQRFFFFLNIF